MICIGIDIAKRSHVASAVDEDGGTVVESFKFDNTANGFAKMLKRLRKADATPENSLVGMEATGRYWVALFDFLISHGYEAAVINPIQTDAFRGVWTVRKVKTDALDAAMIADLVRYKRYEPSALGDEATEELRNLARYRLSLVERSTALKNRATAILDRTFPACRPVQQRVLSDPPRAAAALRHARPGARNRRRDARAHPQGGFAREVRASQGREAQSACQGIRGRRVRLQDARLRGEAFDGGVRLRAGPGQGGRKGAGPPAGADAGQVARHHPRHRRRPRLRHRGRDRRPERLRHPHRLMGYAGIDPTRSDAGETVRSDGHMSKRGPGRCDGRSWRPPTAPGRTTPLRRLLRQEEGRGREAPLRRPLGVARKLMGVALAVMKEGRPRSRPLPATTAPAT